MAASTAFPPAESTASPAADARWCGEATHPEEKGRASERSRRSTWATLYARPIHGAGTGSREERHARPRRRLERGPRESPRRPLLGGPAGDRTPARDRGGRRTVRRPALR